jgi:hypothetical protein
MEASMHGTFEGPRETSDNSTHGRWSIGFLALAALLAIALIGLAAIQPTASNWIAEAVQAEFANTYISPETAPARLVRPASEVRTVRAD